MSVIGEIQMSSFLSDITFLAYAGYNQFADLDRKVFLVFILHLAHMSIDIITAGVHPLARLILSLVKKISLQSKTQE
ncbi:hypothetical protein SK128_010228 [Halocaridina rubra]|uniref:Uncharacterized protein n=1 Tax=Halocaridina rubra TaxID=373956 RepID=A0AAN8XB44_HALRR